MTVIHLSSRHGAASAPGAADVADWRSRGACREENPELFFPVGNSPQARVQTEEAKRVCFRCPVLEECREWALTHPGQDGVCAGMTEGERRGRRRQRRGEYKRARSSINQGRSLALARGAEVILAKAQGEDVATIAGWANESPFAVRHALRILFPPEVHRLDPTALERVLYSPDLLREMIVEGRTDLEISRMFRSQAPVIADARVILEHRAAAADQIGLAA